MRRALIAGALLLSLSIAACDSADVPVTATKASIQAGVALVNDAGVTATSPGLSFDPAVGWLYDEPGNLYVGPAPENNLNEGAITCVAPSANPGYDTGGRCSFYKRTVLGYGLISPQVARTEIDDFETDPSDDGSGSGWTNGILAVRGPLTTGAQARWAAPRTTTASGAVSGEINEVGACGGKLSFGVNTGDQGPTCFNAVNDVEIGNAAPYVHVLLAHTGIALDPAVTPAVAGALSQVQDPAAREVLRSIIAALSSQQLHVVSDKTQ